MGQVKLHLHLSSVRTLVQSGQPTQMTRRRLPTPGALIGGGRLAYPQRDF